MTLSKTLCMVSLCAIIPISVCADAIDDYQTEMAKSIGAANDINMTSGTLKTGAGEGKVDDNFMDSVIYNDIYKKTSHRKSVVLSQPKAEEMKGTIKIATPKSDYIKFITDRAKAIQEKEDKKLREEKVIKKEKPKYFVGGYCIATQRTEIIKASTFGSFNCEMNFGNGEYREISVFAGIYPDYQREIAIAIPIYATMPNGQRMEMSGVIMNMNKTSLNIANEVESYKIRRWVAKYGLAINDVAYKYATMWLADVRNSRTKSQTTYIPTNTGGIVTTTPVQDINTEPPKPSDYWSAMGIELISKLFAIGAENILEDTAPLFTIYQGQRVWVEGVIDTDNSKMFGQLKDIGTNTINSIEKNNQTFMQRQYEPIGGRSSTSAGSSSQSSTRAGVPMQTTGVIRR